MKPALLGLVILVLLAAPVDASETHISGCLDWTVGSRAGIEYLFNPVVGWKADLGMSPFGLVTADAFGMICLLPYDHSYRLNLLLGIPNMATPLTFNAAMVSFGGSIEAGYWVNHRVSLNIRLGVGYPLFFERDKDVTRDIGFPLDLWPDFVFSVTVRV